MSKSARRPQSELLAHYHALNPFNVEVSQRHLRVGHISALDGHQTPENGMEYPSRQDSHTKNGIIIRLSVYLRSALTNKP